MSICYTAFFVSAGFFVEQSSLFEDVNDLCRQQHYAQALALLDTARKKQATPQIFVRMADIFGTMQNLSAALATLTQGIKSYPESQELLLALANTAYQAGKPLDALPFTEKAASQRDCPPHILLSHAHLCKLAGEEEKAIAIYTAILEKNPQDAFANTSLGNIALDARHYETATVHFKKALERLPLSTHIRMQLANTCFRAGDLQQGWHHYEARFGNAEEEGIVKRRPFPQPLWQGNAIKNGALLLWGEQGAGEEVLYASMLEDVQQRCDKLYVECDPRLQILFERSFPDITFIARQDPPHPLLMDKAILAQCAVGQAGPLLRKHFQHFPAKQSYLKADTKKTAAIKARYETIKKMHSLSGKTIGISWKSKPLRHSDPKSTNFSDWAIIFNRSPHLFVNLQYGDIAEEQHLSREKKWPLIIDGLVDQVRNLDDFAAQIAGLDAVITVSNTTAHMAGALGVPLAVLLPLSRGLMWHWFDNGDRSPWYISAHLLRQSVDGKWGDVLRHARTFLDGI